FCFFFQAEDGIRDLIVTGVQTCALPIWLRQSVEGVQALELAGHFPSIVLEWRGGVPEGYLWHGEGLTARYDLPAIETARNMFTEIGRASCRERGVNWVGEGSSRERKRNG